MPTVFGSRRHAPPAQPLTKETANPNAATAAASAFMRRDSNASLSSAAAAAALRARPMTPTNVSQVQSRRTHRRSPSLSSLAGPDRAPRRELQRTPSVGSMMERTFRSPSPARSPPLRDPNVPPVPTIPTDVGRPSTGQSRGTALQIQPFRTASEKMRHGQHGSWFGGATVRDPDNVRRSDSVIHSPTMADARSGSVSPSINFSYPRSMMQSPPPSVDDQTPVYDANSRRMVPRGELVARSQSLREFSDRPKKKKHDIARAGSHLSRGTVGRTQAPALESPQPRLAEPEPAPIPAPVASEQPQEPGKKKKKKKSRQRQAGGSEPAAVDRGAMDQATVGSADMARPRLGRMPSAADEEPEDEASEDGQGRQTDAQAAAASVLAARGAKGVANGQAPKPATKQSSARSARALSESPARSARFAPSTDQLVVRHEPPPRSVSPKKSVMKLPGPRGVSPSDDGSEASGRGLSPQRHEDPALARKKGVRVSWDDRNAAVVGESVQPHDSETPIIPSPQAKRPWHSIVTKYTKEPVSLSQDETMSPRPALPLFGSVREKKSRELEERPLVRPSERTWSQPGPALPGPSPGAGLGQSEPLPAAAPPADGSAKGADVAESDDDDLDTDVTTEVDDTETTPSKTAEQPTPEPSTPTKTAPEAGVADGEAVPTISVSHPSPHPEEPERMAFSNRQPEVPGGFPGEEGSPDAAQKSERPMAGLVAEGAINDAEASTPSRSAEAHAVAATPTMDDIEEAEEEEDEEEAVYSDAHEDLAKVDGFMSLDAVVEGPASGKVAKRLQEQVAAKSSHHALQASEPSASASKPLQPSKSTDEWENAKTYWKSLSVDQRRQLEVEALSETAEDAEHERPRTAKEKGKQKATQDTVMQPRGERSYQIAPGTRWSDAPDDAAKRASAIAAAQPKAPSMAPSMAIPKLRQTLRGEQPAAAAQTGNEQPGTMRKSMRAGSAGPATASNEAVRRRRSAGPGMAAAASAAGAGMRGWMRTNGDADGGLRPSQSRRPVSYQQPVTADRLRAPKRNLSVEDLVGCGGMTPSLRRRASDDSVSSFTRSRAGSGAGHGFRMSMRAGALGPASPGALGRGNGRFSLRSLSPPGFRRSSIMSLPSTPSPMSGGAGRMRRSLRGESARPSSRLSMSALKRTPGGKKGRGARGASLFEDSSDDDEGGPLLFSSRFADSSDDDDDGAARPQSKGRGLARTLRSTPNLGSAANSSSAANLGLAPDGVDDTAQPRRGAAPDGRPPLRHSRSGRGSLAADGDDDYRPRPRRGSLMSMLRRRRDSSGKISRDVSESAARRDTRLERSADELAVVRSNSSLGRAPGWPLPDHADHAGPADPLPGGPSKARPATAGGPPPRPGFLARRSTSQAVALAPDADEPPPHKKFGALRKMFGIRD